MTNRSFRGIALAGPLLASLVTLSCYTGDGDFQRDGTWPFATYSLELQPFELEQGSTTRFRLRGWRSNWHTKIELTLTSPEPASFEDLDLQLAVSIKDVRGNTVFALQPDLAAHLERMRKAGEALAPANEWWCGYDWGNDEVMKHVVPFLVDKSPRAQKQLECWDMIELPDRYYDIEVACIASPRTPALQAQLTLSSGWK